MKYKQCQNCENNTNVEIRYPFYRGYNKCQYGIMCDGANRFVIGHPKNVVK